MACGGASGTSVKSDCYYHEFFSTSSDPEQLSDLIWPRMAASVVDLGRYVWIVAGRSKTGKSKCITNTVVYSVPYIVLDDNQAALETQMFDRNSATWFATPDAPFQTTRPCATTLDRKKKRYLNNNFSTYFTTNSVAF